MNKMRREKAVNITEAGQAPDTLEAWQEELSDHLQSRPSLRLLTEAVSSRDPMRGPLTREGFRNFLMTQSRRSVGAADSIEAVDVVESAEVVGVAGAVEAVEAANSNLDVIPINFAEWQLIGAVNGVEHQDALILQYLSWLVENDKVTRYAIHFIFFSNQPRIACNTIPKTNTDTLPWHYCFASSIANIIGPRKRLWANIRLTVDHLQQEYGRQSHLAAFDLRHYQVSQDVIELACQELPATSIEVQCLQLFLSNNLQIEWLTETALLDRFTSPAVPCRTGVNWLRAVPNGVVEHHIVPYLDRYSLFAFRQTSMRNRDLSAERLHRDILPHFRPTPGSTLQKLADELKQHLMYRDFKKAEALVKKHGVIIADIPCEYRANPYYSNCPRKIMSARDYAAWLDDVPMKACLNRCRELSVKELDAQATRLACREEAFDDDLDAGGHFNIDGVLSATEAYRDNSNDANRRAMYVAIESCPSWVIYAFDWIVWKNIREDRLSGVNVWGAAARGGPSPIIHPITYAFRAPNGSAISWAAERALRGAPGYSLRILNRIASASPQWLEAQSSMDNALMSNVQKHGKGQ